MVNCRKHAPSNFSRLVAPPPPPEATPVSGSVENRIAGRSQPAHWSVAARLRSRLDPQRGYARLARSGCRRRAVLCPCQPVGRARPGPDARYAKGLGAAAVGRFVVLRRDRAPPLRVDAQSASGRDGESVFRRLSVRGVAGRPPGARCVPNARVTKLILRPEIGRDYPLNLSILLSGGKETNKDSLSNGE